MNGQFVFVLHSHLPYVLGKGRWPFGEEWLHEIVLDTYLPLLEELEDLDRDNVPGSIAIGITPILMEQLKSPVFVDDFRVWMDVKRQALEKDLSSLPATPEARALNVYYQEELAHRLAQFNALKGDLVGAFAGLQERGRVEVLTSAATHGYMPLFDNDESRRLQIKAGAATYEHWMGRKPVGFWLPECGYIPGVERLLAEQGLRYFVADAAALATGETPDFRSGRALISTSADAPWTPWNIGSGVAVFLRNPATSEQVWSRDLGYPGDGVYREFHRRIDGSGWQYWRITSKQTDLEAKELYNPDAASECVSQHAMHFASMVNDLSAQRKKLTADPGVIVAAYDTELFGHWWYEGPRWIAAVLRNLATKESISAVAPTTVLAERDLPPGRLRESSWGTGGGHDTWMNSETSWMWDMIHDDQRRFIKLLPSLSGSDGDTLFREILLEESSDWPFLITTGQARSYGMSRFLEHHRKVRDLLAAAEGVPYNSSEKARPEDHVFEHLHLDDLTKS